MQKNRENTKLRVLATLEAKDGKIQELLNILVPLIEPARKEEGNISYDLYSLSEHPNELLFDEVWSSKETFDKHYESQKSYKDREAVSSLLVKPLQIKTYTEVNIKQP